MSKPLPPGSTIGILGGGQLGRMLVTAAARLGYRTAVLEPQEDCPAGQVAGELIATAYDDPHGLKRLSEISDVITYEFENVPVITARSLAEAKPVYPPPEALEAAQDRLAEKLFLNSSGIETAPFKSVDDQAGLEAALEAFGGNGVLKTRRFGYDGKGQRVFRDATVAEANNVFAEMGSVPLILEGFVQFDREISVIAARGTDGSVASYDPAENIHRGGILHQSIVPAACSADTAAAARSIAEQILTSLDYVGVIGVEFFVLPDGRPIVNEIAPRVHNSGHWTEAACSCSQFEQHIRAVAGMPLGTTRRLADCEMENFLGAYEHRLPILASEPDVVLNLYGKAEARPGRKMGHFTRLKR
ncbi:5-(carboxyamino)imidazole ribonucleotide synthase [Nitratireductor sp. CH_MIT9313-5]|uniref:5-(carboxyamino)imidazole ribonucleotide synthase n=1 Tax=Nitratireductor sp. CH_MIT9313-5 TaxID=3107764 RepID=UPI00300817C8